MKGRRLSYFDLSCCLPDCASLRCLILPAMEEAEAYCPPGAGLPTVAHDGGHGITSIRVYCEGLYCPHWRVFSFDELAVPDELPVIYIPPRPPFRLLEMREPQGTG